jgi:hypothetical protein
MAEETKAQLEERLAALQKELEKRDQVIAEQKQKLQDLHAKEEGWLITAPNPLYDGVVHGITFTRGQAYIRKQQEVGAFVVQPMKESQLKQYTEQEQAAIKEREKISSSERAAMWLKHDFGYDVQFFSAEDLAARDALISKRTLERNQAEIAARQAAEINKLSMPTVR